MSWVELLRVPAGATLAGRTPVPYQRLTLPPTGLVIGRGEEGLRVPDAVGAVTLAPQGAGWAAVGELAPELDEGLARVWTGPAGELALRRVSGPQEIRWPALPVCAAAEAAPPNAAGLHVLRDGLLEAEHPLGAHLDAAARRPELVPPDDWLGEAPWLLAHGVLEVRWEHGLAAQLTVRGAPSVAALLAPLAVFHLARTLELVLPLRADQLDVVSAALAGAALPWLETLVVHNVPDGRRGAWERRLRGLPARHLTAVRLDEAQPLGLVEAGGAPSPLPRRPGERRVLWGAQRHGALEGAVAQIGCPQNLCPSLFVQHPARFTLNGVVRRTSPGRAMVLPLVAGDRLEHGAWRATVVSLPA